jgi:DNA primase
VTEAMKRHDLDRPDQLRVDLDPQPGTTFQDAARVATRLRERLDELGMTGFPKTSGHRGTMEPLPEMAG